MIKRLCISVSVACLLMVGVAMTQDGAEADKPVGTSEERVNFEPTKNLTLFELLMKGGPLMYPLYLCSIIMVAFGIERGISLRRKKIFPPKIVERLRSAITETAGSLNTRELLAEFRNQSSPIARVVTVGLRKADRPLPEIEKAIEDAGAKEAANMRRNCRILSIVASVSPLLGLLGTIYGMIQAFMTVAAREEALGRTELLAAGIYQALVTTAAGLTIAIPALVLYYIYVERVEKLVSEMDDITIDLVEKLSANEIPADYRAT